MAAPQTFFFDRVDLYVNGQQYLPNGFIRSFNMSAEYASTQQFGYTPDGASAGQIVGRSVISSMTWTEYITTLDVYINWRDYLIANPGTIITVIPVSLITGAMTDAPSFTVTGINVTNQTLGQPSESEPLIRSCAFNAQRSSNL